MSDTKSESRSDVELENEWVSKPWVKTKINYDCTQWADWHKLTQEEKDETEAGYEQLAMQAFIAGLSAERAKHERVLQMLEIAEAELKDARDFAMDTLARANQAIETDCDKCDYQCQGCIRAIDDAEAVKYNISIALEKIKRLK